MITRFRCWMELRRKLRRAWQADARELLEQDERGAYYAAQRLRSRAQARKDRATAWHWAKAAAEVLRISAVAESDWQVVKRIAAEEASNVDRRN